jgi:hypothetical protein
MRGHTFRSLKDNRLLQSLLMSSGENNFLICPLQENILTFSHSIAKQYDRNGLILNFFAENLTPRLCPCIVIISNDSKLKINYRKSILQ